MADMNQRRWYDRDPILSKAMKTLESSGDAIQIKTAINLIKIIIEHNIENSSYSSVEDILKSVDMELNPKGNSRWYDLDNTVRTSITMLESCPEEIQNKIAVEIAKFLTEKINAPYNNEV